MKYILILLGLFILSPAVAQTETFDILTFNDPTDYPRTVGADYVSFVKTAGTGYCQIIVYRSRAGNGEPTQEFKNEWADLIKKIRKADVPANVDHKILADGWSIVMGSAVIQFDKGNYVGLLTSIIGHGRVTSVNINANTEQFNADIEKFLASIKAESKIADGLVSPNSAVQAPSPSQSAQQQIVTTPDQAASFFKNGTAIVGVWRGVGTYNTIFGVTNSAGTGFASVTYGTSLSVKQIAFFDDGTFCNFMPADGLINYSAARAKEPNYWGKYSFANGAGTIKWDAFTTTNEFKFQNDELLYDQTVWRKIPSLDGWRFDGTFTAEKDPASYNGPEPTITFTANGIFEDHGAIYWLRHVRGYNTDMQDKMTGSGVYEVLNYTVTFKYNDGRVIRMLILNPDTHDKSAPNQFALGGLKSFIDRK
jgi:hypothetical protein